MHVHWNSPISLVVACTRRWRMDDLQRKNPIYNVQINLNLSFPEQRKICRMEVRANEMVEKVNKRRVRMPFPFPILNAIDE